MAQCDRWEYKIHPVNDHRVSLYELGEAGWELVTISASRALGYEYYLKRKAPPKPNPVIAAVKSWWLNLRLNIKYRNVGHTTQQYRLRRD